MVKHKKQLFNKQSSLCLDLINPFAQFFGTNFHTVHDNAQPDIAKAVQNCVKKEYAKSIGQPIAVWFLGLGIAKFDFAKYYLQESSSCSYSLY